MAQNPKCYGNWKFGNPLCRGCEICVYCRDFTISDRVNTIRRSVPIQERDMPTLEARGAVTEESAIAGFFRKISGMTDPEIRVFRLCVIGEGTQQKVKNLLRCGSDRAAEIIAGIFDKFPGLKK